MLSMDFEHSRKERSHAMPFQDQPRYFIPPTYGPRGAGGILPPAWGRPASILAPSEFTLSQTPDQPGPVAPDPWRGRLARPDMASRAFGFSTASSDEMEARRVQKLLDREKL